MKIVSLLLLLMTSGCATYAYRNPGGSNEDFYRSKTDCITKASVAYPNATGFAAAAQSNFFKECMAGQGWYLEKQE